MPFIEQIVDYINASLKAGSLNKKKLQPANMMGLSTVVARKKDAAQKTPELLPAIVSNESKVSLIAPDDKYAIQVYHKLLRNQYSYEKKAHGDGYYVKSISELAMVVFTNSKLTGTGKQQVEPVVLFGLPQRLSDALLAELKINNCLISPMESNMDHLAVFRQEYPHSTYFLNEQVSMFLIRYKIEMIFGQACVDQCLC